MDRPEPTRAQAGRPVRRGNAPVATPEPRWPAILAALAAGGLYAAMPEGLSVGPPWMLALAVAMLVVPSVISHRYGRHDINRFVGFVIEGALTLAMIWSLAMLIRALVTHSEAPGALLRSAALLWMTNVLVFALWYWRLDAGGPHGRDSQPGHRVGAFLFPQMTGDGASAAGGPPGEWSPQFIDYLFLAFNTSTAVSPTDTPVLSRWAKVLMMVQALISLATVAILIGRAVNIL
jgi:hypothetical protein